MAKQSRTGAVYVHAKDQPALGQALVLGAPRGLDASQVVGEALRLWVKTEQEKASPSTRSSSGGVTQPWLHTGQPVTPSMTLAQYEEQQKELAERGGQEYVQDLLDKSLAWRQRYLASLAQVQAGDIPYDSEWWTKSGWYPRVVEDSTEWDADYELERDPKMEDPGVG